MQRWKFDPDPLYLTQLHQFHQFLFLLLLPLPLPHGYPLPIEFSLSLNWFVSYLDSIFLARISIGIPMKDAGMIPANS